LLCMCRALKRKFLLSFLERVNQFSEKEDALSYKY